jgi:hypothetical protein
MRLVFVVVVNGPQSSKRTIHDAATPVDRLLSSQVAIVAEPRDWIPNWSLGQILPIEFPVKVS